MENPIKIDDLGVPLFLETPIYIHFMAGNEAHPVDFPRSPQNLRPTWLVAVEEALSNWANVANGQFPSARFSMFFRDC